MNVELEELVDAGLLERTTDPDKQWKYQAGDEEAARQWPQYRAVYEDVFRHCSPAGCPWHLVPADQNWYKAHFVAQTLRDTLVALDLQYPTSKVKK